MAAISAFLVTQHNQIFSLFFRNRIQYIALYQLQNSQTLLNLRRGYFRNLTLFTIGYFKTLQYWGGGGWGHYGPLLTSLFLAQSRENLVYL